MTRRIHRGLFECCDGHRGRLKLIRVLWRTHRYVEGHQSAVVAKGQPTTGCNGNMRRLKVIRVLKSLEGYAEGHQGV